MDKSFLCNVCKGYEVNKFCKKLSTVDCSISDIHYLNDLGYVRDHLVIPHYGTLRKDLFCLSHDTLRHFGSNKTYAALWDSYYWPNMCHDLKMVYVPSCAECQRSKGQTTKPKGPLHPLPIPDACSESVCLDFVGPLPEDQGFNCILTITDWVSSDVRLVPTRTNITTQKLAGIFFTEWYCKTVYCQN